MTVNTTKTKKISSLITQVFIIIINYNYYIIRVSPSENLKKLDLKTVLFARNTIGTFKRGRT